MINKRIRYFALSSVLLCGMLLTGCAGGKGADTADNKEGVVTEDNGQGTWKEENGRWQYLDEKGKKVTGLVRIGNKTYYFDNKGEQRYGWRKLGEEFYYFLKQPGEKGEMRSGAVVDGIGIDNDGKAITLTSEMLQKAQVQAHYSEWADSFLTIGMTNEEKLEACKNAMMEFEYESEDVYYPYAGWDVDLAEEVYQRHADKKLKLECYEFAVGMAFLLNAAGVPDVWIYASTMHGWDVVGGVNYDVTRTVTRGEGYFPVEEANMLPVEEGYSGDWKFEQGTDSDAVIIENAEKAADTAILMENGTSKEIIGLTVYRYDSSSNQEELVKSEEKQGSGEKAVLLLSGTADVAEKSQVIYVMDVSFADGSTARIHDLPASDTEEILLSEENGTCYIIYNSKSTGSEVNTLEAEAGFVQGESDDIYYRTSSETDEEQTTENHPAIAVGDPDADDCVPDFGL